MSKSIAHLLSLLKPDPWRAEVGFSEDIDGANQTLFNSSASKAELAQALNNWIKKNQPCIFGRLAAAFDWLSYCILTEEDLQQPDKVIRDKIQRARTEWRREAFAGQHSGFVILAVSPRIAYAVPNHNVKELAKRLGFLYLRQIVEENKIYNDTILLELASRGPVLEWFTGINYFCAQGDQRWWHDHRIPGGMALSTNSVGHMVKSGQLANALRTIKELKEDWTATKIESLEKALVNAMRTIDQAQDTLSGKATELLPLPANPNDLAMAECPFELPKDIADKNYCRYIGHYHTDVTLPSEYFQADVERPANLPVHSLDFTYLFDDRVENEDYDTMAEGIQVRSDQTGSPATRYILASQDHRRRRMEGREVVLSRSERKALRGE